MTDDRPNILFIFSDQQHWQAMGCQDPFFETPNLDRLASEGLLFERAFCTTPQCSPSRASMFTGYYPSTTGVMGNVGAHGGDPLRMPTVGAALRLLGYRTGYYGKWHLGTNPAGTSGWDEQAGVVDDRRPDDEATTRLGMRFLRQVDPAAPFALFLSYNDPHDVYHVDPEAQEGVGHVTLPESWYRQDFESVPAVHRAFMTQDQGTHIEGMAEDAWRAYHLFYQEKVRLFDDHVGRVLDALDRCGLADRTLVIVTSDHGDMDTHHRLIWKGPFMYEQMVRVPLVVRVPAWMGERGPGVIDDVDVVHTDIVPTLLDVAGAPPPNCDGVSLLPLLTGTGSAPVRDYVVGQYHGKQRWVNPIRMIRTARYKYNRYLVHGEELYDLLNDPHELVNLAQDPGYRAVKDDLAAELRCWMAAHNDPFETLTVTDRTGAPWPVPAGGSPDA